jgi:hypothetical protein
MQTTRDNKTLYWQRDIAGDPFLQTLDRFSRVDGLAYFTTKLEVLQQWNPTVTVSAAVILQMSPYGTHVLNTIGLRIRADAAK